MSSVFPASILRFCAAVAFLSISAMLLAQSASPTQVVWSAPAARAITDPDPVPEPVKPEELGDAYMVHQRYQAAIDAYRRAPLRNPEIWNKLGVAYQLMFDNRDAEKCYKKALKLDRKNANALNNMGSIYMEGRLYGSAEHVFRRALRIDPRSALFHKNLGSAYFAEHNYRKGWSEYEAALAIDPRIFAHQSGMRVENPATLKDRGAMNFYMAKSCAHAGLFGQAVEYLRMALAEGFTNPKKILADAELSRMRRVPAFQQLMASQGVYLTPLTAHPPVQQ